MSRSPENDGDPDWVNWTGNIEHRAPADNTPYYFFPENMAQLTAVLQQAKQAGVKLRVSGQRHSQPPLVADDNRDNPPPTPDVYLVDMSCYYDVATDGITLGPKPNQITVNPGVREDFADAFLTKNNLI